MKLYLILLLVFASFTAHSQSDQLNVYDYHMADSSEHYVFGDTLFVRSEGSLKARVIDTLYLGHEVLLLQKANAVSTVKGFQAPWVRVSYKRNGQERYGYIWSGLLSFNPMRRGSIKFIFGFDRRNKRLDGDGFQYAAMLKVTKDGKLLDKVSYTLSDDESLSFISGQVLPAGGLQNVQHIVSLTYGGEACGVPNYTYSFAWNGRKLVSMPLLTNVSDADVFYHSETFILPGDKGGVPGMLIMDIETAESTEEPDSRGETVFEVAGQMKYYRWDGTVFHLVKTVPRKKQVK